MDSVKDVSHQDLLEALAKRVGTLVLDNELLRKVIEQQDKRIEELDSALSKVMNSMNSLSVGND
jgi:chaperonin cofactor prefoldin